LYKDLDDGSEEGEEGAVVMVIRSAHPGDAPAMGRVMVTTFLWAHRGHMPQAAWNKRKAEWTPEVSARNWERALREIANDPQSRECIYVAEEESEASEKGEAGRAIVGLAMGVPGEPWERQEGDRFGPVGAVCALYVRPDRQGRGIGRRLVQAVAAHLAQGGMSALRVEVLAANAPARRFYEALGGEVVGEREFDEEGFRLGSVVYGWSDIATLL
jgi:ribosomal protein S18 acetylase RimI-like enzyme